MSEVKLRMSIDIIPGHCGVDATGDNEHVRFMAFVEDRGKRYYSVPSGWFQVTDEPIRLTWRAFEWRDLPRRLRRAVRV